jgi:hypothetical protein
VNAERQDEAERENEHGIFSLGRRADTA